jgi:serine/threonine protein kinase
VLSYVSPEQTGRMGRGADSRSDLYALGATLYFMLTGAQPFEGADALSLIHAHLARLPASPLERRPELPPTLSRIVMKMLQKEPDDRYQTARALGSDLHACREQLRHHGRIDDDLPLGTADAPPRPLFSHRLHGRDAARRAPAQRRRRANRRARERAARRRQIGADP